MKKQAKIFLSAILSGVFIGIAAIVYLTLVSMNQKIIGSFIFGLGLFAIINFSLWLYTGKVGFVLDNKPDYLLDLFTCMVGNFGGTVLISLLAKATRAISPEVLETAKNIVMAKQNDSAISIFILSFLCGIMIYIAVKGHKECPYAIGKVLFVFLPVVIFILGSFEHCIANASYYTIAGIFDWKCFLYLLLMIIGNGLGSICLDLMFKGINKLKETKKEAASSNIDTPKE